jgi:hypothetical protein
MSRFACLSYVPDDVAPVEPEPTVEERRFAKEDRKAARNKARHETYLRRCRDEEDTKAAAKAAAMERSRLKEAAYNDMYVWRSRNATQFCERNHTQYPTTKIVAKYDEVTNEDWCDVNLCCYYCRMVVATTDWAADIMADGVFVSYRPADGVEVLPCLPTTERWFDNMPPMTFQHECHNISRHVCIACCREVPRM